MGLFGKDEVVDYTLLAKKGLLKLPAEKKAEFKTEGDFVDLGSGADSGSSACAQSASSSGSAMPDLGFLGSMASVGASQSSSAGSSSEITPYYSENSSNAEPANVAHLKVKIEDMEYKMDRFIERIDKLEEKLARLG